VVAQVQTQAQHRKVAMADHQMGKPEATVAKVTVQTFNLVLAHHRHMAKVDLLLQLLTKPKNLDQEVEELVVAVGEMAYQAAAAAMVMFRCRGPVVLLLMHSLTLAVVAEVILVVMGLVDLAL
jgi:hypothetical protein